MKPLLGLWNLFQSCWEESHRHLMLGLWNLDHIRRFSLALSSHGQPTFSDNRLLKSHLWCDHCKKLEHINETCWVLHNKPQYWKLRRKLESLSNTTQSEQTPINLSLTLFSMDQLDVLQQLISKAKIFQNPSNKIITNHALHVSDTPSGFWCFKPHNRWSLIILNSLPIHHPSDRVNFLWNSH